MLTSDYLPSTIDHYALSSATASVSVMHTSKMSSHVESCTFAAQCRRALYKIACSLSPASRIQWRGVASRAIDDAALSAGGQRVCLEGHMPFVHATHGTGPLLPAHDPVMARQHQDEMLAVALAERVQVWRCLSARQLSLDQEFA